MNMKILGLVAFVVAAMVASGKGNQYYCGRRLSETLEVFCNTEVAKRSGDFVYNELGLMELEPSRALTGLGFGSRYKRGVVDECCYKSCDLDELLTYC